MGEWHSHPQWCSARPSKDDLKALAYVAEIMSEEGYPGVLVIQSDGEVPGVLVGEC